MMKPLIAAALMALTSSYCQAQKNTGNQTRDAFYSDQKTGAFGFRLPESAQRNDVIFITQENGMVVKKAEIDNAILQAGKYSFATNSLPPGNYIVSVTSNTRIKYRFRFSSRSQEVTQVTQDSKLMSAANTNSKALRLNPAGGIITISTTIRFTEGNTIEVTDERHNVIATAKVTPAMISAKEYIIASVPMKGGTYYVSIDGVAFGSVSYAE